MCLCGRSHTLTMSYTVLIWNWSKLLFNRRAIRYKPNNTVSVVETLEHASCVLVIQVCCFYRHTTMVRKEVLLSTIFLLVATASFFLLFFFLIKSWGSTAQVWPFGNVNRLCDSVLGFAHHAKHLYIYMCVIPEASGDSLFTLP